MSDDSNKAEELLQQSKNQKRHTTDPAGSSEGNGPSSLQDAVKDAYTRLDDGEMHENLTVRDGDLAALMAALEETGELSSVGEAANQWLDRDEDASSRAAVLKLLLRVGLNEVAADEIEAAKNGKREFLASQADDF